MKRRSWTTAAAGGAVLALAAACAVPEETEPGAPPPAAAAGTTEAGRPPAAGAGRTLGYLGWEDLSVRMVGEGATAGLRIDITTLDDEAVALAADDVRTYLEDMKTRIPDAVPAQAAREMRAFLVAFSGFEKEVRFDPSRLQLRSEGSSYYPRYVVPVSREFDRRLVGLYETVYAIYLFDASIDLRATLEFQYAELTTGGAWRAVVERIERARGRGQS
ncbi:MAG TPA: hypothetical protein VM778_09320 [Gemmatimonadota bacterium]|nr:hypothetical protein [Gemmatimonadota bacterium]